MTSFGTLTCAGPRTTTGVVGIRIADRNGVRDGCETVGITRPFSGDASWDQWIYHFESVAEVNTWDGAQKLKWLKVRMIGHAQKAFQHLPAEAQGDFERAKTSLRQRFEPESKKSHYEAEFQTRRRKKTEAWADFAEDLRTLTDKAYPELQQEARERLTLNAYLGQLDNPRVAFAVKQKSPKSLDAAVAAMLEMESYLAGGTPVSGVELEREKEAVVTAAGVSEKLTMLMEKLTERMDRLERQTISADRGRREPARTAGRDPWRRPFTGECWRCGKSGHIARYCHVSLPKRQGN